MNNLTTQYHGSEIAIIGMTGRFPGAKNVDEFWHNLQNGVESISFFSDAELLAAGVEPELIRDPNFVKAQAVLNDVELFDAHFFGFNPKEAEITDPQQRLFLECAWEAIENAGYNSETYQGAVGVYAGVSFSSYLLNVYLNQDIFNSVDHLQMAIASDKDYLSTRVSYKLNLTGPSYTVQTACSTSLVAVHLACQSLLNGECDMALAGGVSISGSRKSGYIYKPAGIMSPDGHCRAFDAQAQGTVSGEGVGIVVLKRLEDALTDGDTIHALIKGSAINNDGARKVSYTAPRIDGQAQVIKTAQAVAEVEPDTITYIEAHGTGTSLGDPIEIAALTQAFGTSSDKKRFCAIGSVKTNIGHLDAAAGVAGLIKTVLALKHKQIPPSLHFSQPNPEIDFANSPFYVNKTLAEWSSDIPRRAGVSSFGIGGTNAHLILEEAPAVEVSHPSRSWHLLVLSAKSETALASASANLATYLAQNPHLNIADVAYTLQVGRRDFDYRRMCLCQNLTDAISALNSASSYQKPCHRSVVFMFSPQGAQYAAMGRELYQTEPIFKQEIDRCCAILKPHLGIDLRDILYTSTASEQLTQTAITQPALFITEYALAKLWMSWGIHPEATIGHSIGEYVAAAIAGVFSLEDALAVVALRGRLMQELPRGAMLSVQLPASEVKPLLGNTLSLAGINAPSLCVVAGTVEAIASLELELQAKGVGCRRLQTSHAFHSSMMEAIVEVFTTQLQKFRLNPPQIPFISNVSGTWITPAQATDPNYWATHLRQPVLFSPGMTELLKQPERILLEVGPGRTLCTFALQHQHDGLIALSSLRHPQEQHSDVTFLLNTLGHLWQAGIKINWSGFYADEQRRHIPLPTYPFERQRYWIEPTRQLSARMSDIWQSVIISGHQQANASLAEIDTQTYLEKKQCLEQLCIAYINLTFQRLGAFSSPTRYSVTQLQERCQIIPRYEQLLHRWLDVLVERTQLQQAQDLFTNFVPCSTADFEELSAEVETQWAASQVPTSIQFCGDLADVLTGEKEPLSLYLSATDNKNPTLEKPANTCLKSILRSCLAAVVKALPADKRLRILEIGAGHGIATTELLPILPPKQTNYTFTDVGAWFLQKAQQKFSAYPFVDYRLLNIEQPPTTQGFTPHSFDVIVAVNVLHVTQHLNETLDRVRSLLAPGGLLLLWEITEPQLEFDITDALLMNPLADAQRSRGNPFLSTQQWREMLSAHGFAKVEAFDETAVFAEQVLVAEASPNGSASAAFTAPLDETEDTADINNWFYLPTWKRTSPLPPFTSYVSHNSPETWLVFVDDCGLGDKLVQNLTQAGQEVIAVKAGCEFGDDLSSVNQNTQQKYILNPKQRSDYDRLFQELRRLGKIPSKVIHLWSVTPDQQHESISELGFYSLLFLAQAIGEQNFNNEIEIGIVSNHIQDVTGSEVLCPEKALILGFCRVMPLEYPNITCRSIDIDLPAADWQEKQLIDHLLTELVAQTPDPAIAYRGHHRWLQTFEPMPIDAVEAPCLRQGGVYLITGGLGGIGLALAEYLAQTVKAKLVLVGRSHFPHREEWELLTHTQDPFSEKIRKLQAIEALGAEITIHSADVADYQQMAVVVQQAKQKFGAIHGVIHAAAVPGGGMIQLKTPADVAQAFAPKVQGTRVLDALFQDTHLDFFVLCSSLSSFTGTPGMVDYTAENAFLDAFAHYNTNQNRPTISINWDRWDIGMAIAVEARHKQLTGQNLSPAMSTSEGIAAFRRILATSQTPQILVYTQNIQNLIQPKTSKQSWDAQLSLRNSQPIHPRPQLINPYVAPTNEIEQNLVQIWQQLLGIDQIGIHDNFFELGGDSLFATQLVAQICKNFQIELPYKSFFNAPTIAQLSVEILQQLTQLTDEEELAKALAEIEQLSNDEAQVMLALQE
ncbi:SDR family NAD(P)-dependent oxidoreductase [Gloeocapsopsis crepidinum LEGE 06123]|uniref:SDR family NAD(P)-dependent oxidoreductase n=1 Tax=Gloeocapsopsis crepidinum LEGE 06123 TaxID=588587 RepID=A0ABR9UPS8_9CHRO|nr:type I polyketide synthase [Gloeocapsopsis crepidinum]MBE9190291.1 SDR family NAD(P)-dependent oxidoreductase [Gloeocapsopsis crepidinum LEGE 06123]